MSIFCIAGLSGTGKSTLAKIIAKRLDIPLVISYTTRPKRPTEQNGIDYYFIDDQTYDVINDSLVAKESFEVDGGYIWRYGFHKSDVLGNKNVLCVINPKGIQDLKNDGVTNIVPILIEVDETERINRILSRNDNQTKAEIKRRTNKDKQMFEHFKPQYNIINDDLEKCVQEIIDVINKESDKQRYEELYSWINSRANCC